MFATHIAPAVFAEVLFLMVFFEAKRTLSHLEILSYSLFNILLCGQRGDLYGACSGLVALRLASSGCRSSLHGF